MPFGDPMAFNRFAMVRAQQEAHPGEIRSQPVEGFQVVCVHWILLLELTRHLRSPRRG